MASKKAVKKIMVGNPEGSRVPPAKREAPNKVSVSSTVPTAMTHDFIYVQVIDVTYCSKCGASEGTESANKPCTGIVDAKKNLREFLQVPYGVEVARESPKL